MTWKLDGTIIAQCAFGSCDTLGALTTGDIFTYDESRGEFFLDIGITRADAGNVYQCDDGSNHDQIIVSVTIGSVSVEGGEFINGKTTKLICTISPYRGGMTWKMNGTIIAQCAFGSCNTLGALPTGDIFTHDESRGVFNLDIGITEADNGTTYECGDGSIQVQTIVNVIADRSKPKVIFVTCEEGGWNIRVDMSTLRLIYPNVIASDIYLGENNCHGTESMDVLRFNYGYRDCLTQEMIRNSHHVFSNQLLYPEYDPIHPYIIKDFKLAVDLKCYAAPNGTITGHSIDNSNNNNGTHQQVSGGSHFSVNMLFYSDPNFQHKLRYPLSVTVGENVYVKVFTNASDWDIRMHVHTCYTLPNIYAADNFKYYLIRNGCEVDSNTHISSQSFHETRFVFKGFQYANNRGDLLVSCDAKFCGTHDNSPECLQVCNPNGI
ncbi:CUB and zona pellucida-like domains 1 [Mactra antiquata]